MLTSEFKKYRNCVVDVGQLVFVSPSLLILRDGNRIQAIEPECFADVFNDFVHVDSRIAPAIAMTSEAA